VVRRVGLDPLRPHADRREPHGRPALGAAHRPDGGQPGRRGAGARRDVPAGRTDRPARPGRALRAGRPAGAAGPHLAPPLVHRSRADRAGAGPGRGSGARAPPRPAAPAGRRHPGGAVGGAAGHHDRSGHRPPATPCGAAGARGR
jgi:hypothetical protein